jgi:hypothetical protein
VRHVLDPLTLLLPLHRLTGLLLFVPVCHKPIEQIKTMDRIEETLLVKQRTLVVYRTIRRNRLTSQNVLVSNRSTIGITITTRARLLLEPMRLRLMVL